MRKQHGPMFVLSGFVLCWLAACLPAVALMEPLTTEDLVNRSTSIIVGTVISRQSAWADDGKKIVTRYQVLVGETVAGTDPGKIVEIEHDGGEVGELGQAVSDVATMPADAAVLLFLQPVKSRSAISKAIPATGRGTLFAVSGMAQGRYFIGRDGMAVKTGFSVVESPVKVDVRLPLADLKTSIKRLWAMKVKHIDE